MNSFVSPIKAKEIEYIYLIDDILPKETMKYFEQPMGSDANLGPQSHFSKFFFNLILFFSYFFFKIFQLIQVLASTISFCMSNFFF